MSPEARRSILLEVAAGRLSPEEAASQLGALRRVHPETAASRPGPEPPGAADPGPDVGEPAAAASSATAAASTTAASATAAGAPPRRSAATAPGGEHDRPPTGGSASTPGVTAIRIEATAGRLHVTGDPEVSGVAVDEGEHTVRHEGTTIVVERTLPVDADDLSGFVLDLKRGRRRRIAWANRDWRDELPLVVRVNPDLPLELQLNAGAFSLRGVHAETRVELNAGSGRITGFRGPLHASVNAGSLTATGRLDHGRSQITCDAGVVRLALAADSDVAVTVAATLGKVDIDLPGIEDEAAASRVLSLGSDERSFTLGEGAATLDVRVNLGKVHIGAA